MTVSIHGSVGENGENHPDDVRLVYSLFNKLLPEPLAVSDHCSAELVQAIKKFQKPFFPQPDGRIDVNGTTWKRLTAVAGADARTAVLLPGNESDKKFDAKVASLNLEDSEQYEFTFKTTGTSIGFKVAAVGKRKSGLFLPENSATHLEGEVVAYRLSRVFGVSEIFNPVAYYDLKTNAIAIFKAMLRDESNKWRRENTDSILKRISSNPHLLPGIYKYRHELKSQPVEILANSNQFNTKHRLSRLISAEGPLPGSELIGLEGVRPDTPENPPAREKESVLAAQLSVIFSIDMLTGQWDRFSGGNIEAYTHKDGRLQLVSRDNGGSNLLWGSNWFNKYRAWLTRFDSRLIAEIRQLNDFLDGKADAYNGITSSALFMEAIGFSSLASFSAFKAKLDAFVAHVQFCEKQFGKKCYFSI